MLSPVVPLTRRFAGPVPVGGVVVVGSVTGGGDRRRGDGWRGHRRCRRVGGTTLPAGVLDLDIVDDHRHPGPGGRQRAGLAGVELVREGAAHGDVQDDEVPRMLREIVPDLRCHITFADVEGLHTVQVPAHLIGRTGVVPLETVGVETGLAGGAQARRAVVVRVAVVDALRLVARRLRPDPAMQHVVGPVQSLDVFHDVEFADSRPRPPVGPIWVAEHPECRPVASCLQSGDIRHLQTTLDVHDAAGRWLEVRSNGLHPGRGPGAGSVPLRGDVEISVTHVDIVGIVGHRLYFAGTEIRRSAGIGRPEGEQPIVGVRQAAAVEIVAEGGLPAGCGGDGAGRRDAQSHRGDRYSQDEGKRFRSCGHRCPFDGDEGRK